MEGGEEQSTLFDNPRMLPGLPHLISLGHSLSILRADCCFRCVFSKEPNMTYPDSTPEPLIWATVEGKGVGSPCKAWDGCG